MHCFDERRRTPSTQIANAVHADCERRPCRLRTPSMQIANAVHADCERRPCRLRTPSMQIANAVHADRGRYTTTKVDVLFAKS